MKEILIKLIAVRRIDTRKNDSARHSTLCVMWKWRQIKILEFLFSFSPLFLNFGCTYYLYILFSRLMDIFCRLLLLFAKLWEMFRRLALFGSLHMPSNGIYCYLYCDVRDKCEEEKCFFFSFQLSSASLNTIQRYESYNWIINVIAIVEMWIRTKHKCQPEYE